MSKELDLWRGDFGDDYTKRNIATDEQLQARRIMWGGILNNLSNDLPTSILEVGAGSGTNIQAIHDICAPLAVKPMLYAMEPNPKAVSLLHQQDICKGTYQYSDLKGFDSAKYDLVFTSGVLIHIHPSEVLKTMTEIYRVSAKYVLCAEYFSPECREIAYRGKMGALWANDFGGMYLNNFPLQCLGYGFLWKRLTGLDDLTWTLFRKVN